MAETIHIHRLLPEDLVQQLHDHLDKVALLGVSEINSASRNIQQLFVDFIQAEIEKAHGANYPFRIIERTCE